MGICLQNAALLTQADGNWMRRMGIAPDAVVGGGLCDHLSGEFHFYLIFCRAGQDGHEWMKKSASCCIDLSFTPSFYSPFNNMSLS